MLVADEKGKYLVNYILKIGKFRKGFYFFKQNELMISVKFFLVQCLTFQQHLATRKTTTNGKSLFSLIIYVLELKTA